MKKTPRQLKAKLDKVFSLYIRTKYADWRGNVACYTCGRIHPIKSIQCGHFIRRQHLATRWDENNARPQDYGCNVGQGGNYDVFALKLLKEIGQEGLEELQRKKDTPKKWKLAELESLLEYYQQKLAETTQ